MRIIILIVCLFITCLQINLYINQSEIKKREEIIMENQLKILNIISIDKVDTDFQIESITNKFKELENKNNKGKGYDSK